MFEAVELARRQGLAREDYAALLQRLRSLREDSDEQRACLINYGLQRLDL